MKKLIKSALLLSIILSSPINSFCENAQSGEFVLETTKKKKDPYKDNQDSIIKYFDNIQSSIRSLQNGNSASLGKPEPYFYKYLNAVYLDCANKRGVCPIFLDSLLEVDVINSKKSGKASCPTMKRYWKSWIENDMEKRQGHKVKTGLLNKTKNFNKQVRPKYIKCQDTIQKILDESKDVSSKDFFQKRYKDNGNILKSVMISKKYLESVKQKVPNIFFKVEM